MPERCQLENSIYRLRWPLGYVRSLRREARQLSHRLSSPAPLGAPSRFREGDWVRVLGRAEIGATLDADEALRGLRFTKNQWSYCGRTYRVERVVRRMMDDEHRLRSISRTVVLAGATCDGPDGVPGCGRACSLLFRDEWLEPSSRDAAEPRSSGRLARVRSREEIEATLDRLGRLDGVAPGIECDRFVGRRLSIARRVTAEDGIPSWKRERGDWFVLDGARCSGKVLGRDGPCHRNCGLLWHRSWLLLEDVDGEAPARGAPETS